VLPNNRVVGAIELDTGHAGIGAVHYALAQEYWGQGLMTEACRAVIDWAFREHSALTAVETNAMETNKGSRRVLEKSGFSYTGIREDHWNKFEHPVRVAVYTLSRDQWERDAGNL
jgi:RimJ/RimL family protein N-acetyltransferase